MSSLQTKWLKIYVRMRLVEAKPSTSKQSPLYLKADQASRYCARLILVLSIHLYNNLSIYLLNHFLFYLIIYLLFIYILFLFSSQPVIAQKIIFGTVKNAAFAQAAPLGLV